MEKDKVHHGRTKITSRDRHNSYSSRAALGKLMVEEKECPNCNHEKAFSYIATGSPFFGMYKCTRCGNRHGA